MSEATSNQLVLPVACSDTHKAHKLTTFPGVRRTADSEVIRGNSRSRNLQFDLQLSFPEALISLAISTNSLACEEMATTLSQTKVDST